MAAPLRLLLIVALAAGLPAPEAWSGADADAIAPRLQSGSLYDRRKALDELMAAAPEAPRTAEILIGLLRSPEAEEARYADFMQHVGQAIQRAAQQATWPAGTVELLTATLVHNDAYDSRATSLTAATVAAVARYQAFSPRAIDDLRTVLWHRVDRNPNRVRNDNTRARVVLTLRHLGAREELPLPVLDEAIAALGTERNVSVRRETVLLIDDVARARSASDAMVRALRSALEGDESAVVRALAARTLRGIGEQRGRAQAVQETLLRALSADPDPAVRREALAALTAVPTALPPRAAPLLLQAASADRDPQLRLLAVQALARLDAVRPLDPVAREALLRRLREEPEGKVRGLIAATLQEMHARDPLGSAALAPLVPLATDDPVPDVRRAIGRMLFGPSAGADLAGWLNATRHAGLRPADAVTVTAVRRGDGKATASPQLYEQYAAALSADAAAGVRAEILEGLYAASLQTPLPQAVVERLGRRLTVEPDARLRLETAAVLLHDGLQHRRPAEPFRAALGDGDAAVRDYAAFALVELGAAGGEVLPVLLAHAQDPSAHPALRLYCLRRMALWRAAGSNLPASVEPALQALTREPDAEIRAAAWNALRQADLPAQAWQSAADDDDLGIRRMAWRELQARGVAKPLWAKWRDPKERLQLIAVALLAATLLGVLGGAVAFFWRLLRWWQGERRQRGRMLAAQLLWLLAALGALGLDAAIVFALALAHSGISERGLLQLDLVFGGILAAYALLAWLAWQLLPGTASSAARPAQSTS